MFHVALDTRSLTVARVVSSLQILLGEDFSEPRASSSTPICVDNMLHGFSHMYDLRTCMLTHFAVLIRFRRVDTSRGGMTLAVLTWVACQHGHSRADMRPHGHATTAEARGRVETLRCADMAEPC